MSQESISEPRSNRSSWLYWLVIAGLFLWVLSWLWWYEPEHDEVEHWHVAWLMHQGQQPFQDFFEHHSPLLWNLLRIYYVLAGENYAIILVSRALMVIVFALTIWLIYRIARRWVSPGAAWIAALGFPTFSLGLLLAHLFVRSDPLILLLLVVALWLACPLVDGKNWEKRDIHRLFWIFICLGLALGFSPRAGIPVAILFLMIAIFGLKKIPFLSFLIFFVIGGIIVILPTVIQALIYNPELYFYWVYYFSATLYPSQRHALSFVLAPEKSGQTRIGSFSHLDTGSSGDFFPFKKYRTALPTISLAGGCNGYCQFFRAMGQHKTLYAAFSDDLWRDLVTIILRSAHISASRCQPGILRD